MMKKNVVLIMVDQLRFDCLGVNGNDIISTPNLDMMAQEGCNFTRAYSATPTCIPARASLLTGLKPEHHGKVGYQDGTSWDYEKTLPKTFTQLGYQTECVGKMHVYPSRNRVGFEHVELHDGYLHHARNSEKIFQDEFENSDDYLYWLKEQKGIDADLIDSGLDCNSWVARPWPYEEKFHPTNWVVTKSIDFLRRRDTTKPFFLKASFTHPHAPLDPPKYYFDMYMDKLRDKKDFFPLDNWRDDIISGFVKSTIDLKGQLKEDDLRRMIAAYYGSITHIDHQISRLLMKFGEYNLLSNTVFLFVSDHGDQLDEHHLLRKAYPYEGSVHVPLIVYDPGYQLKISEHECNELVELRDIYPSLVDFATGEKVTGIDGKSFKTCLTEKETVLHDYLHGEHAFGEDSNQFILTKDWKYIWYSRNGLEQLFHLKEDPQELNNVVDKEEYGPIKKELRQILVQELRNREEGFVKDDNLHTVKQTPAILKDIPKK